MRNKNRSKQEMSNQKISKQKGSKMGRKGLEFGKGFRSRFWEGLFFGKLALSPKINHKINSKISQEKNYGSHTTPALNPRGDNKNNINNINNKSNTNNKSGVVWDNNGTRRIRIWEGVFFVFITIFICLLSLSLVSSQTNESNQTNPSNLSNESVSENDIAINLEVGYNEFDALEDELDNLAFDLSGSGYDWDRNYVDVENGGIL